MMESEANQKQSNAMVPKISWMDLGIEPNHPQWNSGIACIRNYIAQATVMNAAQQQEMLEYIVSHQYDIHPPVTVATSHKLYKKQMAMVRQDGEGSLSWPIFLILSALYPELPQRYLELVRNVFGTSKIEDHTKEYFKSIGTELELTLRPST